MAAAQQPKPDVGDILLVIHDFQARSSDELTLAKGDRVELLERDDEFGDGWFLGKHMVSGNTGLFPEVYTRPAPRGFPTGENALAAAARQQTAPTVSDIESALAQSQNQTSLEPETAEARQAQAPTSSQILAAANAASATTPASSTAAITTAPSAALASGGLQVQTGLPGLTTTAPSTSSSFSSLFQPTASTTNMGLANRMTPNQDSQVLHETLNVIDEHITDLRSPSGANGGLLAVTADSGSEYSAQLDHRMSYIHGEETDEEEEGMHTRAEVESWTPDDVAEYFFTMGVEKRHCEVFRDQEITGEVILGMDQTSLFINALDLGPVGRRLKTWQKIKNLQDEVNSQARPTTSHTRRSTQTYGSDMGSDDARRSNRSRTNTLTSSSNTPVLQQRLPPIDGRSLSIQSKRLSLTQNVNQARSPMSPHAMNPDGSMTGRTLHEKRPSAASIRDMHHSRRHSSVDYRLPSTSSGPSSTIPQRLVASGSFLQADTMSQSQSQQQHRKHPSFDRNWTLGNAAAQSSQALPEEPRRLSAVDPDLGMDMGAMGGALGESAIDYDRGYFSGPDTENHRKPYSQKKQRDSVLKSPRGASSASRSSYTEEQRVRSATALSRHSHFGSVDSMRDSAMSPAAQKYYGVPGNGTSGPHHRNTSTNTTDSSMRPVLPPKDTPPPTVTRLDTANSAVVDKMRPLPASPASPSSSRNGTHSDWFSSKPSFKAAGFGLRALSDAVSGHDRTKGASGGAPPEPVSKDSPVQSPSRAGSSTPSVGPSFELDSPDAKSPSTTGTTASARSARKKGKKETSAYLRGLQKISPREAITDADYSGWMKKKSSNLMATWKPRLFVLKGRRLAYYYSEDDVEEKGLIDISFHRVLPADNERLTGLHATITGASASAVPANSSMPTLAAAEAEAEPESTLKTGGAASSDSIFIFKLVPPRAGLSRAVNFTKPMVHYFAVPNIAQGRLWMAALVKATIDRDDTVPITTTYQQKTISLNKARQMQHRPPALMNLDEQLEGGKAANDKDDDDDDNNILGDDERRMLAAAMTTTTVTHKVSDKAASGLGITYDEEDSGVSAVSGLQNTDSSKGGDKPPFKSDSARSRQFVFEPEKEDDRLPMSA